MSRHNYTNQAFSQDENVDLNRSVPDAVTINRSQSVRSFHRSPISACGTSRSPVRKNLHLSIAKEQQPMLMQNSPSRTSRNELNCNGFSGFQHEFGGHSTKSRYALVPMKYLERTSSRNFYGSTSSCLSRSHENVFRCSETESALPARSHNDTSSSGFSTNFGSKSFIMFDQKKFEIIPTDDNEEIVDNNHEIIQIHNGKTHRYAVIPTEVEDDHLDIEKGLMRASSSRNVFSTICTPPKQKLHDRFNERKNSELSTPTKNPIATQKLYELLATPKRPPSSAGTGNTPNHFSSRTPKSLYFDQQRSLFMASNSSLNVEQRTTAVIQPRLNTIAPVYSETTTSILKSSENNSEVNSKRKLESHKQTIALIGYISVVLIILGVINSALCIYITSISSVTNLYTGKMMFLDIGILSGFATVALSFMGFKFRFSPWMPNRHYVTGFMLVSLFSIANVAGLVTLIVLKPIKGTPIHDVTTGIVSALSSIVLLFICLGFISSRLCLAPPADARVEVY